MLYIKQGIPDEYIDRIINWSYDYFKDHIYVEDFIKTIIDATNFKLSLIIIDENDKILGVYLLGDKNLNLGKYKDLKGLEGVLLAVDESIRGQGWGNKLKDYPKQLGYDYIWGQQLKSLNNLNDWLKRRKLVAITEYCFITLEEFNNETNTSN